MRWQLRLHAVWAWACAQSRKILNAAAINNPCQSKAAPFGRRLVGNASSIVLRPSSTRFINPVTPLRMCDTIMHKKVSDAARIMPFCLDARRAQRAAAWDYICSV
jgi:hypothetical protein